MHNDGQRDIYYYRRADDDEPTAVIELHDDEARQLGAIIGGAYERPRIVEELEMALGELQIEWVPVPDTSPAIGRTLAECKLRAQTGVTVIAILREPEPVSGAQPDDVIQQGDTLVAVGKAGQFAKFRRAARRGPVRHRSPTRPASKLPQARRALTSASIAGRSSPATSRKTRSAFSISSPGSSPAISSGVTWMVGSLGPPTPSVMLARSWPMRSSVPPGASAADARSSTSRRSCGEQVEVEQEDEVVRAGLGLVLEQVGDREVDVDAVALGASSSPLAIATSEKSTPTTSQPRPASQIAFWPSPHARSRARPGGRSSTSATRKRFGLALQRFSAAAYLPVPVLTPHAARTSVRATRCVATSVSAQSTAPTR